MNKKLFYISTIIILILFIGYFILVKEVKKPFPLKPFPLNDKNSQYYLEKIGDRFVLVYAKNNYLPISLYVSADTDLDLENYVGKALIVEGKFIEETNYDTKCVKEPCIPMTSTVVHLDNIKVRE